MYPVSEEYLDKIESGSVNTYWHGEIKTVNGVVYSFSEDDIVQGSGKITRQICNSEDLEIGTTCSAQLDMSLYLDTDRYELYKGSVTLFYSLQTDNGWEEIPIGIFYITEPPERVMGVLTIHAYDAMEKFNADFGSTLIGNPYYMLNYACNVCGVELGNSQSEITDMTNGSVDTYTYEETTIPTYRDLIGHIASFLCGFAYIGVDGKLYIGHYGMDPIRTITEDWRYEYKPMDYETYYTALTAYFMVSQETEYFSTGGFGGLTYALGGNPLIQFEMDETRHGVLNNILSTLAEVIYTPFTARVPCDPSLMVGDVLNFTGNHATDGKLSAITRQVITIKGGMELSCAGKDPGLPITETQKEIQAATANTNKDGMYYYDFVNTQNIHIDDGKSAVIMIFNYITTKATHVDYHGELRIWVDTTEAISDDGTQCYENDGVIKVIYSLGGFEVTEYYPRDTFFDGMHLLHLMYFFWASGNLRGTFTVSVECEGCSVDIETGAARGYIAGTGLAGESSWDGSVHIADNFLRRALGPMIHKQMTTEVTLSPQVPINSTGEDDLVRVDFGRMILKGLTSAVSQIAKLHRFTVAYNAEDMTYDNIRIDGDLWYVDNTANLGFVTTPNCNANQIVTITSKHSGNDVAYIVSFDGGITWWTYNNGWIEPDYTQDVYGMFEGTMRSITQAQWAEKLNGTIMVQAILIENASLTDIQIYMEVI